MHLFHKDESCPGKERVKEQEKEMDLEVRFTWAQILALLRFQPRANDYLASLLVFPHLSNEAFKQPHRKPAIWVRAGAVRH